MISLADYVDSLIDNGILTPQKKVFCFGAGAIFSLLVDELLEKVKIEKVIDNNTAIHGDTISEVEIVGPDVLESEPRGSYVILILTIYVNEISKQLCSMGLLPDVDFLDMYTPLSEYVYGKYLPALAEDFKQFLDSIPEGYYESIPVTRQEHIGVVCIGEMATIWWLFSTTQALFLRSYGYKVTLIIDNLKGFDSYYTHWGIEIIVGQYIRNFLLPKIREKCPDMEIRYIDEEGIADLDSRDHAEIKKTEYYVMKWYAGRYDEDSIAEREAEYEHVTSVSILSHALSCIKAFFTEHRFDAINVGTGAHKHRGMYVYIANLFNMRVSTYDVFEPGKLNYSAAGPVAHCKDVAELFRHDYFSADEKAKIIRLAKEHFGSRINSTLKKGGNHYQSIAYNRYEKLPHAYDIIIPLNVPWDAAALYQDDLFENDLDWLDRTLNYILERTNATVMIRVHPVQELLKQFYYVDVKSKLPVIRNNSERIRYVEAAEKINTYQHIENCKLVLPYTSTVGIEATLLGKNVIVHTNVYYKDMGIVYKAPTAEAYFKAISYYLDHPDEMICKNMDHAYLGYYYRMNYFLNSEFCLDDADWMMKPFCELRETPGVQKIVNAIAEGIPPAYFNIKEVLQQRV